MTVARSKEKHVLFLVIVGLLGWLVPGGGHLALKERKRAMIIFATLLLTFGIGIYVGSIGVVDPVNGAPWYIAQIINSPAVALLGHVTAGGGYPSYGRANEIGQIYTTTTGLLNLLCIINAVYLAHTREAMASGD